ncbi:MAG: glutaredoxin [Chlamydiae bacterium]|nr:glutaredoxin [Chlamydiota bacterium]
MKKALISAFLATLALSGGVISPEKPILYSKSSCIYCQKVFSAVKDLDQKVEIRDVNDPLIRLELIQTGGKAQVPCLVIDGVALYESDAIILHFTCLESDK